MRTVARAVADVGGAGVAVVATGDERCRLARVRRLVARGEAVGRRDTGVAGVDGAVARLTAVGAVAEDAVVARAAIGHELTDAAPDVVAMVVGRTGIAVEAVRALPDELAIELAAAEREV